MPKIIIHTKKRHQSKDLRLNHLVLYQTISELGDHSGIDVEFRIRDADIKVGTTTTNDDRFQDGNLHIVDDRNLRMNNVLNASMSYFSGFWHLDPLGIKGFSSIGNLRYDPSTVPEKRAYEFFENHYSGKVMNRRSRYRQLTEETSFPNGIISVFFQGSLPRDSGATQFSDIQMLETVLKYSPENTIVVKPHPMIIDLETLIALDELANKHNNLMAPRRFEWIR